MIENYISKEESKDAFTYNDKKISLREYQKDLVFYWSGEEEQAEYSIVNSSPDFKEPPTVCQDGKFGNYSKISSPINFDSRNFESIEDNLSLSFYLGANTLNGYYSSEFKKKNKDLIPAGDYSLVVQVDGETSKTLILNIKKESTTQEFKNNLLFNLDPSKYNVNFIDCEEDNFILCSAYKGKKVSFSRGMDGTSILDLFEIVETNNGSIPTENIPVVNLQGIDSSLLIEHINLDNKSKLKFTLKQGEIDKTTSIDWNNDGINLDNVEVDIDSSVMYVFLNGELKKAVLISPICKTKEKMTLTLNGTEKDPYSFEEIIIKNRLQNKESFKVSDTQLTKYDNTIPYIDFYFLTNNISKNLIDDFVIDSSENISLLLNFDGIYYYYQTGSWRKSDGSFLESNDKYIFQDSIKNFEFKNGKEVFIRAFFETNGTDPSWIKDLYFKISDESILGNGDLLPAILIGENEFPSKPTSIVDKVKGQTFEDGQSVYKFNEDATSASMTYSGGTANFDTAFDEENKTITLTPKDYIYSAEPAIYKYEEVEDGYKLVAEEEKQGYPKEINLKQTSEAAKPISLKDKTLIITTDKGKTEIVFDEDLFIDDVPGYIKSKYPEGIIEVKKDSMGRLVLISETKGPEAFIQVAGDAGFLLFGKETSAQGNDKGKNDLEDAYDDFLDKVKDYLNSELIPIEISDASMRLYLQEALNIYKKYRSTDESIYSTKLEGDSANGYKIPPVITDTNDIVDIIFRPIFPIGFYTGGFDNDMEDVVSLTLVNAMMGKGSPNYGSFYGKNFTQDYYISLMNIQDMNQTLGLNPQWKIYTKDGSKKLYIFPNNISKYLDVTIVYKSPINPIEALRDDFFMKFICGTIMMRQGNIRGQFGGSLSAGQNIALNMNADSMYDRGRLMREEAENELKKQQLPLGFIFG